MPLVEFTITKAESIEIESIRFANTFVNPNDGSKLNITPTLIQTKNAIDCPTTNSKLKVNIRADGTVGLKWTFDLTVNGNKITVPNPIDVFVDNNGRADLRQEF
jgi:hypothetical protein